MKDMDHIRLRKIWRILKLNWNENLDIDYVLEVWRNK